MGLFSNISKRIQGFRGGVVKFVRAIPAASEQATKDIQNAVFSIGKGAFKVTPAGLLIEGLDRSGSSSKAPGGQTTNAALDKNLIITVVVVVLVGLFGFLIVKRKK